MFYENKNIVIDNFLLFHIMAFKMLALEPQKSNSELV